MRNIKLSKRMQAVAGLVPHGVTVCDVGCDHGFVAIYLIKERICPKVIAMDINKGPLMRAEEHIRAAGLSSYIETRLSDGVTALKAGEADCMIAAGMGGRLIVKIMEDGFEKLKRMRYLILQPQSELSFVRGFLRRQGFRISKENMVFEDGKFYPMMLAEISEDGTGRLKQAGSTEKKAGIDIESLEDEFGPCLLYKRHPVLFQYLDFWEGQQKKILSGVLGHPARKKQVEEELTRIGAARKLMEQTGSL